MEGIRVFAAGAYLLRLWHPAVAPGSEPAPLAVAVGSAEAEQDARLNVASEP